MAGTITGIGGKQQIWNLDGNMIDTSQLVQLELQTLEMKKTPYNNQKKSLTDEKNVYSSLKTQFGSFVQSFQDLAEFKGNEKKVTLSQDGYVSVQADGSAIAGTFNIEVKQIAERHQIKSDAIADMNAKFNVDDTININGKPLKITQDMTYKDLINTINNGNYGVSAYTLGNQIFVSATKEGTDGKIQLQDGAAGILANSGLVNGDGTIKNEVNPAKNAIYNINNTGDVISQSNSVNTLPGVSIHLDKVTEANKPIKFTVDDSNVKDAADAIKKMVSEYNKAVSSMDLFSGKGGVLQGQTVIQTIRQAMNKAATFAQDGKFLFSYGVEITKEGVLKVNEQKLTKALKEEPEAAKQFFFGTNGLGKQMTKQLDKTFGDQGSIGEHLKGIDDQIKKLDEKIDDIDQLNKQRQDAIVDKYSKLEQQLSMLNMQLKSIKAMTKQKNDD
ncbi:flagellar filament capping protein FliD [Bacillus pseudomycoides]|nr:flagellar filament capping protein FliD [Bacillus pseudomycoides]